MNHFDLPAATYSKLKPTKFPPFLSRGFQQIAAEVKLIHSSAQFDQAFYQKYNKPFWCPVGIFSCLHYVLTGESRGLKPAPRFSPKAYLTENPDIDEKTVSPYYHYLTRETVSDRELAPSKILHFDQATIEKLEEPCEILPTKSDSKIAVAIHIFHPEVWIELAEHINYIPESVDLYITIVDREETKTLESKIKQQFPDAHVYYRPNHGRDLFPFIWLVNSGCFNQYEFICKVHTKKSPHLSEGGDDWRKKLLNGILPETLMGELLEKFRSRPDIGIVTARGQVLENIHWSDPNRYRLSQMLARLNIRFKSNKLKFAAGTMFWCKPIILQQVQDLGLTAHDFEPELGQVDGTTAHVMERALGYLSIEEKLDVADLYDLLHRDAALIRPIKRKAQLHVDEISPRGVIGWAIDPQETDCIATIFTVAGGRESALQMADEHRADVANAGIGNGRYGFSISIPPTLFDGAEHQWVVSNTSRTLSIELEATLPSIDDLGAFYIEDHTIMGWCQNPTFPDRPLSLDLVCKGYKFTSIPSEEMKKNEHNSRWNFELKIESNAKTPLEDIQVLVAGSGVNLKKKDLG